METLKGQNAITDFLFRVAVLLCGEIFKNFRDITFFWHLTLISGCQVYSKDYSPHLMIKETKVAEIKPASLCPFLPGNSDCTVSPRQTSQL